MRLGLSSGPRAAVICKAVAAAARKQQITRTGVGVAALSCSAPFQGLSRYLVLVWLWDLGHKPVMRGGQVTLEALKKALVDFVN